MSTLSTQVVICGGGPAGIVLGYLLARAGIDVIVVEKHKDFFRDFRGDTIHPSTMGLLDQLGLLERFLELPHDETKKISVHIEGQSIQIADFTHLKGVPPFVAFIPQWDFLNFMSQEAKKYPTFHLLMGTQATDLIKENGDISGIMMMQGDKKGEIRADLVIGADGRTSTIRDASQLKVIDRGAPIDVLWFRISKKDKYTHASLGSLSAGKMMVLLDRGDYWQCAYIIHKGAYPQIQQAGITAFQKSILDLEPALASDIESVTDFESVKLLTVRVDFLKRWYQKNLLCIGDASHAMSPVGGVGINLAIQDATAAANVLIPAFSKRGKARQNDLKKIQKRRQRAADTTQKAQVFIHKHVLIPILESKKKIQIPWQLRLFQKFPGVFCRIPARLIGIGVYPERLKEGLFAEK